MAKVRDEDGDELVKCIFKDSVFFIPSSIFSIVLLRTQRFSAKKYLRYKEGAELYSMSERKFMEVAAEAEAVRKVGKLVLVNLDKIDEYIELHSL